jgi:predicted nucleic acid-binding protein
LDTNIIIDFLDKKRPNHKKAEELIGYLILNSYNIVISEDMLSTIFFIDKDTKKVLKFFKTVLKKWEIVSYGLPLMEEAIETAIEQNLDLEDLLQCFCAKKSGCEVFITEDKGFCDCGLAVFGVDGFFSDLSKG